MSSDVGALLQGALPLIGVVIGAGASMAVQRSSAREARLRSVAEARQAQRAEVRSAIASYLEAAQHLQTHLYAREHGRDDIPDVAVLVEQVWLGHAQVDLLCSEGLRGPLVRHAEALNEVARHEERHPDWWAFVLPYKAALMDAIRDELKWRDATSPTESWWQ